MSCRNKPVLKTIHAMARSRRNDGFARSKTFDEPDPKIEDEILEVYSQLTETSPDLCLNQLEQLFHTLEIPDCFVYDILQCVDYYYEFIQPSPTKTIDPSNAKQYTTINLLRAYTISSGNDLLDIVDIDKLFRNVTKLVRFRNNYSHIYESWKLFVSISSDARSESSILNHRLSLPDLKKIKTALNLDPQDEGRTSFGDALLIDMLSCCSTDSSGNVIDFDFNKPKIGSYVSIKDFGEILGNLGEIE